MKRMRSQPFSLSGLPSELVEEILSRVSATSFKQVRSTCKQWYALFNDHRFIKRHFDNAPKKYLNLVMLNHRFSLLRVNLRGLDPSVELEDEVNLTDLHYTLDNIHDYEFFHCDGLLLCSNRSPSLVVWNPCTGQTSWIPTYSVDPFNEYALGYETKQSCRVYKIMRFLDVEDTFELEIYEFNSNSWRVLDRVIPDFSLHHGVTLKGNTYWISTDKQDGVEFGNEFLMTFDFTTERFREREPLPHNHKGFGFRKFSNLSSVRDERLAVLFEDEDTSTMEIWMTNKITETKPMSWNSFVKIDLNTIQLWSYVSFFIDQENKVAVCFDSGEACSDKDDVLYIVGENGCRKVNLGDGVCYWPGLFNYVPSLVQIES